MISIGHKGDFKGLSTYLNRVLQASRFKAAKKYAEEGVAALASATPVETGLTANSWYYEIEDQNGTVTIRFNNSNVNKHVNIALILQYGHGTRNGGYVQGRDYINPALQPIFDKMADAAWKEVTNA